MCFIKHFNYIFECVLCRYSEGNLQTVELFQSHCRKNRLHFACFLLFFVSFAGKIFIAITVYKILSLRKPITPFNDAS